MVRLKSNVTKVDTAFVMLLFVLFAITTFILVLVGVKQYQVTANNMSQNYQIRTATSYLTEKVRQNDNTNGISLVDLDGTQAIALTSNIDETEYYTYIYFYQGQLRELFVSKDSVFTLETGQAIIELTDFSIEEASNKMIKVTLKGDDNTTRSLYLASKSN